jgi:serine phosphatase RsbU (regulator of sigma subunit)
VRATGEALARATTRSPSTATASARDGHEFGPDRLMVTLAGAVGQSAEAMADTLLEASQRFAPGAPIDDTALLVVRVP